MNDTILVSPEMTTLIGFGPYHPSLGDFPFPADSAMLTYCLGSGTAISASLRIDADATDALVEMPDTTATTIRFIIQHAALNRLFSWDAAAADGTAYHLTTELRSIALSLRDCPMQGDARTTYRLAKSIELLCETVPLIQSAVLVPLIAASSLSPADSARLIAARAMIDERWSEKLTLGTLARACGINRAKLTRGFREVYQCSIAEALAEKRLGEASRRLRTTDLPVSSIGYESGYLNNASFARAFGRKYGVSPSQYRGHQAA